MNRLTQQDILAHQQEVPWPNLYQVEQDLLLCQSMIAIFNDEFLSKEVAMRGGTVLHKVHLAPACRYSEDIDLVAVGKRPKEHIRAAIKRVLTPILGKHKSSIWATLKLAVRNASRPSEILRVIYEVPSVSTPGRTLTIEIEANVTERMPHKPVQTLPFAVPYRDRSLSANIISYDLHEMLGTKMRALFQRKKGRDLFDLYRAITLTNVSHDEIIRAFQHYMSEEETVVPRSEFDEHLDRCLKNPGFCSDMKPLLLTGVEYDPLQAAEVVRERLLSLLPA
jgi:predicted nucleotidyltransferase component of viral defense system